MLPDQHYYDTKVVWTRVFVAAGWWEIHQWLSGVLGDKTWRTWTQIWSGWRPWEIDQKTNCQKWIWDSRKVCRWTNSWNSSAVFLTDRMISWGSFDIYLIKIDKHFRSKVNRWTAQRMKEDDKPIFMETDQEDLNVTTGSELATK